MRQHDDKEQGRGCAHGSRRAECEPLLQLGVVRDRQQHGEEQQSGDRQGHEVRDEGVSEVSVDHHVEVELREFLLSGIARDSEVRVVRLGLVVEERVGDVPIVEDDLRIDAESRVVAELKGYEAIMDASLYKAFKPHLA